jgi:hypothetical protein
MEPINNNDNGQGQSEHYGYYEEHRPRRHRRRNIILLVFAMVLPIMVIGMISSVIIARVMPTPISPAPLPHLTLIENINSGRDLHMPIEDIRRLYLTSRNGAITIKAHSGDTVFIRGSENRAVEYSFNHSRGTLSVNERNGALTVYVPHNHSEAVFESLSLAGRNGRIQIHGDFGGENNFLTEDLSVETRNGAIILDGITVSGQFDAETRNGGISLRNVIADESRLSLTTRNGDISVLQ